MLQVKAADGPLIGPGVAGGPGAKQLGETDAVRLRDEPKQFTISVEVPGGASGLDFEAGLPAAKEQLVAGLAVRAFVGQLDNAGPMPFDIQDFDSSVGPD